MTDKAETIDNDQEAVPHEDTGEELAEEGEDLTEEGEDMTEEEMRHAMAPKPTKIELEGKTMADFEFFRQRKIVNKEGEETGHGLVAVPKDSCIIQVEYKCPYCQYDGIRFNCHLFPSLGNINRSPIDFFNFCQRGHFNTMLC